MAFNFDTSNPTDTYLIPTYPSNERAFRTANKAMLEIEHDTIEGRHKFGIGDDAARDAILTWVVGSTWYSTQGGFDVFLQVCISVGPPVWHNVDARGGGLDSDPDDVAHLDEQSDFVATQFATYEVLTPGAGSPMPLAISFLTSPIKSATISANTILSNPVGTFGMSGKGATISLDLLMDATPGHVITFGNEYFSPDGATPVISSAINTKTTLFIRKLTAAQFVVTSQSNLIAIV